MNPIEEKIGIPDQLVLNGVIYTVKDTPELSDFVARVAKTEKSKLYSQMENLKSQVNQLNSVQLIPETVQAPLDSDKFFAQIKSALGDMGLATKADLDEVRSQFNEVVRPLRTDSENAAREKVAAYRTTLIQQYEAECFPELVKGETKEELDRSLQESIALRKKYPSHSQTVQEHVTDPALVASARRLGVEMPGIYTPATQVPSALTNPQPAPVQNVPAIPNYSAQPSTQQNEDVKSMSMEEFASKRAQLLQNLSRMQQ